MSPRRRQPEAQLQHGLSESEALAKYSTPGLRRSVLTRAGKKWHLYDMRQKYGWSPEDIEKILDELYPPNTEINS